MNYAVVNASLKIDKEQKLCLFNITIDTDICPVMEYFEIFLDRMVLCRKPPIFWGSRSSLSSTTRVCCNTNHTYNS